MRYASIRSFDISNGDGIGVALFVQGCHFHCKNCFNPSTWDFNGGIAFTTDTMNKLLHLIQRPQISRFTLLGGEPLAEENREISKQIVKKIKEKYPDKTIWLYTGYILETIIDKSILEYVDVLVDGQFVDRLKDLTLKFRGSSNQRILYKGKDF